MSDVTIGTEEPRLSPDEANAMLIRLGVKLISLLQASADLGHSRPQFTARDYMNAEAFEEYPPPTDDIAAIQVVLEFARAKSRASEILERHPWLELCVTKRDSSRLASVEAAS